MVHAHHTSVALAAVMRSWSFEALADFAVLQEGLLFGLLKGNDTERVNYRIVITVVGIFKSVKFVYCFITFGRHFKGTCFGPTTAARIKLIAVEVDHRMKSL